MSAPEFHQEGPVTRIRLPFDGSIQVRQYDLMFLDADDVKPFSSITDQTSLALNQAKYAPLFAGASMDSRNTGDAAAVANFPLATDFEATYDCASTTWAVGDLIGPVEDAGGTYLENQKVAKVTDPRLAIGVCTKAGASVTRVRGLFGQNAIRAIQTGMKFRYGTVTLDGGNPTTVATGLTIVTGAVVSLKAAATPGDDPSWLSHSYSGTDGNLDIYAYKNTGGTDPTLVASTNNTATVDWVAFGY